jgi:hypothetical protein
MGKNDSVRDDELLYRSVRSESEVEEYFFDRGKLIIRPAAFNDKRKKPSVDRAELREFDPENYAHSQIIVAPEFFGTGSKQKSTFKKLRVALATLATENGWRLEPQAN